MEINRHYCLLHWKPGLRTRMDFISGPPLRTIAHNSLKSDWNALLFVMANSMKRWHWIVLGWVYN